VELDKDEKVIHRVMTVNNDLVRMQKETIVAYFEAGLLSQEGLSKTTKNLLRFPVSVSNGYRGSLPLG
jgi:hypothetical protein